MCFHATPLSGRVLRAACQPAPGMLLRLHVDDEHRRRSDDRMRRRRRNVVRFRLMVLTAVTVAQLPGIAGVAHFTGSWLWPVLGAALVSAPFVVGLRRPLDDAPKTWLHRWVGLWPFFAWWTASLAFAVLAPVAWAAAKVAGIP